MTSIADTAVGRLTVTIGTDFSSASWIGQVTTTGATAVVKMTQRGHEGPRRDGHPGGGIRAATTLADPGTGYDWAFFGDFA